MAAITHRSGDIAATAADAASALAAAAAAQADADQALTDAATANTAATNAANAASDANTAATNAANAATDAQTDADQALTDAAAAQSTANDASTAAGDIGASLNATGVAMAYAPTTITATSSADSANLTVPTPITLTDGHKYMVEGVITARKTDGTLLVAKKIEGVVLNRSGGNFGLLAPGDERLLGDVHADTASYFDAVGKRPALGFSGSNVTLDWNAIANFRLEADLTMADLGVSSV